jgi:hypothetical protein
LFNANISAEEQLTESIDLARVELLEKRFGTIEVVRR